MKTMEETKHSCNSKISLQKECSRTASCAKIGIDSLAVNETVSSSFDQTIDRSMADQLRLSPDGKANSDSSSDTVLSSPSIKAAGDYPLTSDDSYCYSQIFLPGNSLAPPILHFTPQDVLSNGNPGIRVVVGAADDEKNNNQTSEFKSKSFNTMESKWTSNGNVMNPLHHLDPAIVSASLPSGHAFHKSVGISNGSASSQHHLVPGKTYGDPQHKASPNRRKFGPHHSRGNSPSNTMGIPMHNSSSKHHKQSNVCQQSGQHIVHLHVNPGETISFQIGEQVQLFQGPATVRMVSNNSTPPVPMPVQVPPGHMIQQIVDENGTLRHIILSSQPATMAMPHMHHLGGSNSGTPNNSNFNPSNSTATNSNGPAPGSTPFFGYPPPFVSPQYHHHHMQSGTGGLTPPPNATGSSVPKSHLGPGNTYSSNTGQHHHVHHHHHHHHGMNSCNTGHPPKTGDQVGGYCGSNASGGSTSSATGSVGTSSSSNSRDERTQKQFFRLKKKLEARGPKEGLLIFPPALNSNSILNHPMMTATPTTAFFLSPSGSPKKDSVQAIQNVLSKIEAPTIQNVGKRDCVVCWKPPHLEHAGAASNETSSDKETGVHENDLTYELYISERKIEPEIEQKDGRLVYSGTLLECRVDNLKPGTEYFFVVRAFAEDISGTLSLSSSCKTECSEPDKPLPPRLTAKSRTSINLKWSAPADNHSRITNYILEYDEGQGGDDFVGLFSGLQKQFKVPKLNPSTIYRFRLMAINAVGKSDYSDVVSFSTSGCVPSQPLPPTLRNKSVNSLQLEWQKRIPLDEDFTLQMEDEVTRHGFLAVYNGRESSYTCGGLRRNSEYKFRLCSNNEEGASPWSKVVAYATLPAAPSCPGKPTLKGKIHAYHFRIEWDKPKDDGGSRIKEYVTEIDKGCGFENIYTGSQTDSLCDGLSPGTTYCIRVACDSDGGTSPYSETTCITTLPVCPDRCLPPRLHGKPKAFMLHLKWSGPDYDGGSPVTEYEVSLTSPDNVTRQAYIGSDTDCVVAGLLPGRPYLFQVRASNRIGAGPWSESLEAISGAGPPDAPLGIQAVSRSPHTVAIFWDEPLNNGATITEYKLEWCQNHEISFSQFTQLYIGPNHSFEAKNLTPATNFSFRVQAANSAGFGSFSECVTCQTQASSPAVISSSCITLTSCTADSFGLNWKEPLCHGAPILHYNLEITSGDSLITTTTLVPEISILNVSPETAYRVRVQAVNNIGPGSFSSSVKVITKGLPPLPPVLSCISASHNSLRLKWGDGRNSDLIQYSLEMENRQGSYLCVYMGTSQSHKVGKLQETTTYKFRIRASSDSGDGPYSAEAVFNTSKALPPALKPPKVSWQSASVCSIEWSSIKLPSSDPVSYILQLQSGRDMDFQVCYQGPETRFQLTNLVSKTPYIVRVSAIRHCTNGEAVQGAWCPATSLGGFPEPREGQKSPDYVPSSQSLSQGSVTTSRKPLTDQQLAGIILCSLTLLAICAAIMIERMIS